MISQRQMVYFPFSLQKNARGQTDRDYHGDLYTHSIALGIIITTEKPSNGTVSV